MAPAGTLRLSLSYPAALAKGPGRPLPSATVSSLRQKLPARPGLEQAGVRECLEAQAGDALDVRGDDEGVGVGVRVLAARQDGAVELEGQGRASGRGHLRRDRLTPQV